MEFHSKHIKIPLIKLTPMVSIGRGRIFMKLTKKSNDPSSYLCSVIQLALPSLDSSTLSCPWLSLLFLSPLTCLVTLLMNE